MLDFQCHPGAFQSVFRCMCVLLLDDNAVMHLEQLIVIFVCYLVTVLMNLLSLLDAACCIVIKRIRTDALHFHSHLTIIPPLLRTNSVIVSLYCTMLKLFKTLPSFSYPPNPDARGDLQIASAFCSWLHNAAQYGYHQG
mmetsp:Transcript_23491/g.50903  ORF Transcript_23491/g.50903 Transcript_23491/m.50903 type:complete len:139 (-) Transcript_23491:826-1242(-)